VTPVRFLRDAQRELVETARYYERCSSGLGGSFLDEIARVVEFLSNHPEAGRPLGSGYRRLLAQRFPYALIYRVTDKGVICVAVAHARRDPGYWRRRNRRST